MSFMRKLSFRKKTSEECTEKPRPFHQTALPKHNEDTKAVLLPLIKEPNAMSETDESVATVQLGTPIFEGVENNENSRSEPTVDYLLRNGNESVELLEFMSPPVDHTGTDPEDDATANSLSNKTRS